MLNCKLEDFQVYRNKLFSYASNLLRGRGFVKRNGELDEYANDIVQNVYLKFHEYGMNVYVNEFHLFSSLKTFVYREFCNTIDLNRRGAQYILLKQSSVDSRYKEEFRQLDVRNYIKPTQDEFDIYESFNKTLHSHEQTVLEGLLEGLSQKEISEKYNVGIWIVNSSVKTIKEKYLKYESTIS